jgi:uncharacterized protein
MDWIREIAQSLIYVVAGILALWLYARYFEWRNLFFPARRIDSTPAMMGLSFEDVVFVAEDGRQLHGWWIPHGKARGTVVHCHGNAGNIGDRVWIASDLHQLGVNVFLFDYRGYGKSRGIPTEQGTYRDARAAYEFARARHGDAENPPIVVHGQSLGGAVAVQLAADKPIRALIVESTFSSTIDIGKRLYPHLPIDLMCRFRYDSAAKVRHLNMPKLFAHSRQDEVVPYDLGRQLYDGAAEPKTFVEMSGGHNETGWYATPEYWHAIEAVMTQVFGPQEVTTENSRTQ